MMGLSPRSLKGNLIGRKRQKKAQIAWKSTNRRPLFHVNIFNGVGLSYFPVM